MKKLFLLIASAGLISSCDNMSEDSGNNKVSDNKARVQRFYDEVVNAHNVNMIDSFCHPEFTDHNPSPGHSGKGSEELKVQFSELFAAMPDAHLTPEFMVGEGDTVAVYLTLTGTNTGPLGNMPATNKAISIKGIDIVAIRDGKATDRWGVFDDMGMMMQMGMMGGPPADTSKMTGGKPDTTKK